MVRKKHRARHDVCAGGLVFKRAPEGVFLALIKDPYGKWTFPKGHVEASETIVEAAARETLEELGLDEIRLLERLGKIDIWFRDQHFKKGELVHKDIYFYLFSALPQAELHPQISEHVLEAAWLPAAQVAKKSEYKDLAPIISQALKFVAVR